MKKLIITMAIGLIALTGLLANHFEPAWMFEFPQNPYLAMNFFVYEAHIQGALLNAGDEKIINVSMDGGGVPGSAIPGHFITFKIWESTSNMEYSYPEMSVFFDDYPAVQTTFETQGTAAISITAVMAMLVQ